MWIWCLLPHLEAKRACSKEQSLWPMWQKYQPNNSRRASVWAWGFERVGPDKYSKWASKGLLWHCFHCQCRDLTLLDRANDWTSYRLEPLYVGFDRVQSTVVPRFLFHCFQHTSIKLCRRRLSITIQVFFVGPVQENPLMVPPATSSLHGMCHRWADDNGNCWICTYSTLQWCQSQRAEGCSLLII